MLRRSTSRTLAMAAGVLSAGIFITAASAQPFTEPAAEASTLAAATIDEVTLDKFVDAFLAVQKIQKDTIEGQKELQDQATIKARESEMQGRMGEAVQKSGLQIEEFNRISQLMLQDQDLRARISAKLQMKKPGG